MIIRITEKQLSESIFKYVRYYEAFTGWRGWVLNWVPMSESMMNRFTIHCHNRAAKRMQKLNERFPDLGTRIEA